MRSSWKQAGKENSNIIYRLQETGTGETNKNITVNNNNKDNFQKKKNNNNDFQKKNIATHTYTLNLKFW